MTKLGRIPTLDGLRAVAILMVICSHASQGQLAPLGRTGVLLFFALSGYLITTRLINEYRRSGYISLGNFYLRRAFRIIPPALVYLAVLTVASAIGIVICTGKPILAAMFFCVNYIDPADHLGFRAGHFWSLSVEEHFYLLWPLMLISFGVMKGWRTALALIFGVIIWRALDHHFNILAGIFHAPWLVWNQHGTETVADTLLWGCVLAFFSFKLRPCLSAGITVIGVIALILCVIGLPPVNANIVLTAEDLLPAVILGSIVSCPSNWIGRFLELAPMRFIGHISYSLYIWQQMFIWGPGRTMPVPLGIAAAFACAYLSYRFIELPSIDFGRTDARKYMRVIKDVVCMTLAIVIILGRKCLTPILGPLDKGRNEA
jgi:peptidoglycan/LPS O-acetylase OafA/YrhL